ncbi:hypothetical protein RGU70_07680 [Herbaspirillum sp. RTI4]|uniref:hypothetical protein n=1 Tax=Herbaspirillum sp. RTI4 TaxID=3048640 RepID=UPI002AB42D18|nr:hypothetical protein [Herbaspirillum sp. RTI4]MDY7578199.1 hypothetical protein [Herbaspirillum sp. RTI4]MEA9981537.1 hypothetical protein [Herbaspirillum sp. RTI4]
MEESVFVDPEFHALIVFCVILPLGMYITLMRKDKIQRRTMLLYGVIFTLTSAASLFLLRSLAEIAIQTVSLIDDLVFASGVSVALYLLPLISAEIGISLISQVLTVRLDDSRSGRGSNCR